jgi:hypothetical protein
VILEGDVIEDRDRCGYWPEHAREAYRRRAKVFSTASLEISRQSPTEAIRRRRSEGLPIIDLTESTTTAGFSTSGLLAPLGTIAILHTRPIRGLIDARRPSPGVCSSWDHGASDVSRGGAKPRRIRSSSSCWRRQGEVGAATRLPAVRAVDGAGRGGGAAMRPGYHGTWSSLRQRGSCRRPETRAVLSCIRTIRPARSRRGRDRSTGGACAARRPLYRRSVANAAGLAVSGAPDPCSLARVSCVCAGGMSSRSASPGDSVGWLQGPAPRRQALGRLELVCDTYLSVSTPVNSRARVVRAGRRLHPDRARIVANFVGSRSWRVRAVMSRAARETGWYAVLRVPDASVRRGSREIGSASNDEFADASGIFFDLRANRT